MDRGGRPERALQSATLRSADLDGVCMFVRADVNGFFNSGLDYFGAITGVANDRVVVQLEFLTTNLRFKHFGAGLKLVAGADAMIFAEELQHSQEFAVRGAVLFDGRVNARAEHLLEIWPGHPSRRYVVAIGLGTELWVERQGHF